MRALLACLIGLAASVAEAQAIVTSPAPDTTALTVYRDPTRGLDPLNLEWLGGVALVTETRRIALPAGESEVRFEGVTGGIIPQSAIVTGLGEAVLEKNRDARLLSPGNLLNAYLSQRVTLRRTSRATGAIREMEAVVRSSEDGVIIQTAQGVEALRCTGLNETPIMPLVPPDLSAKPTLSVRVRSPRAAEVDVTLSYLTNNFDWQADYVGELSSDGRSMSLFGWLTMANGDETALRDAATQAVAGKVNYERVEVEDGDPAEIGIECWPSDTTSDIAEAEDVDREDIVVTGSRYRMAAPPPPPPPPPAPERDGDVTAQEETLGDVRLYRIPIAVTVAARSQKQIALLRQPRVSVDSVLRLRAPEGSFQLPLQRIYTSRNRPADGLGVALPAGKLALFGNVAGRRILLGEGSIDDHTVGEKVEFKVGTTPALTARQTELGNDENRTFALELTNDSVTAQKAEIELPLRARALKGGRLSKGDGWMIWRVSVPANGAATLRYRLTD